MVYNSLREERYYWQIYHEVKNCIKRIRSKIYDVYLLEFICIFSNIANEQ